MAYSKYGAKRTKVGGVTFASKKEARRYSELKLLELAGEISILQTQKTYRLEVNGTLICKYIADFWYRERKNAQWVPIVEDVKGGSATKTDAYIIKRKLMKAIHGIEIRET